VVSVAFSSVVSVCVVLPFCLRNACTTTASELCGANDDGDNVVPAASRTSDNGDEKDEESLLLACVDVVDDKEN
jgi:hypothetical protein